MLHLHKLMTFAVAALLAASCAGPSTTVDAVWTSPSARAQPPLKRVVTVFRSNDITTRHAGEDQLARELYSRGVQATPSYTIFGDDPKNMTDLETMKTRLRAMGFDGVVTMRVVDKETNLESVPGTFDTYWGYWGDPYWGYGYPGYLYTETTYRTEAAAYSLATGQLVWSGLMSTVDPDNTRELIDKPSEIVAGELAGRGIAGPG